MGNESLKCFEPVLSYLPNGTPVPIESNLITVFMDTDIRNPSPTYVLEKKAYRLIMQEVI